MKKFTKGMLIAAGIFGAVGIGLTAAGGVMGASMSELTQIDRLKNVFDFDVITDDWNFDDDYDEAEAQEKDVDYDVARYESLNIKGSELPKSVVAYING